MHRDWRKGKEGKPDKRTEIRGKVRKVRRRWEEKRRGNEEKN